MAALCACMCAGQARAATPGQPDAVWTPTGSTVLINVLANDGNIGKIRSVALTKPLHGKVRWVSGRAEYTPNAAYAGADSFRYSVIGTSGRAANQKVTLTVGGANVVVLQGVATDAPLANATVTANVGIARFLTTTDANGNYSLPVSGSGGTLVQLNAFGKGAQSQVQLRSTVGGIDKIRGEAGDGVLTRDENNQVQVTQLSTAQAYLLYFANGSQDLVDQDDLDLVAGSIDVNSLTQMAAAIKLVADGTYPLPAGVDNTYALISNPDALAGFVADVNADDPGAIDNAIAQTVADANVVVPAEESDFVGTMNLIQEFGTPGTVSTGYIQGDRLQLDADGTGTDYVTVANPDPGIAWSFDGSALHIVADHPMPTINYVTFDGVTYQRIDTVGSFDMVKLYEGGAHDIYAYNSLVDYHYPGGEFPDGSYVSSGTTHAIEDGSGILPYTAGELATPRAFAVNGRPAPLANGAGAAMFSFNANGTGNSTDTRHFSRAFDWSIDGNGSLVVTYPDNGDTTTYTRIGNDGSHGDAVMAVFDTAGGYAASFGASYVSDGGSGFSGVNLAQSWLSGFSISSTSVIDFGQFYVRLDGAGSTGSLFNQYADGSTTGSPLSWLSPPDGTMLATSYWSPAFGGYTTFCGPIQLGVCEAYKARTWQRIAVDGNRIYVLEELYGDGALGPYDGHSTSDEIVAQRLNFYEVSTP
ncbi:hypothetical protein GCM10025793_22170 [Lysobacter lycopersici]